MTGSFPSYGRCDCAHGIMFHHFFGGNHVPGEGAINAETLAACLDFLGQDRIISPQEWIWKAEQGKLASRDLCLSFDDGLACQFDIALPVLRERALTAFWFIHTGPLCHEPDRLEVFRLFRNTCFETIDDFYQAFYEALAALGRREMAEAALICYDPASDLAAHPYYSEADVRFRFVRDFALSSTQYHETLEKMMVERQVDPGVLSKNAWMNADQLKELVDNGHEIGLHSHTHPTVFTRLSDVEQRSEYERNREVLQGVAGRPAVSVAYPCNSYDDRTLRILKQMRISVGFRANMQPADDKMMEMPREDHANLVRAMRKRA